jgi:hypothetical protein
MLYDTEFNLQEAWEWTVEDYRAAFDSVTRLSPAHKRGGRRLWPRSGSSRLPDTVDPRGPKGP